MLYFWNFDKYTNIFEERKDRATEQPTKHQDTYFTHAHRINSKAAILAITQSKKSPMPLNEALKQQEHIMNITRDEDYSDQPTHFADSQNERQEKAREIKKTMSYNIINRLSKDEVAAFAKPKNLITFNFLIWYSQTILKNQDKALQEAKNILDAAASNDE